MQMEISSNRMNRSCIMDNRGSGNATLVRSD